MPLRFFQAPDFDVLKQLENEVLDEQIIVITVIGKSTLNQFGEKTKNLFEYKSDFFRNHDAENQDAFIKGFYNESERCIILQLFSEMDTFLLMKNYQHMKSNHFKRGMETNFLTIYNSIRHSVAKHILFLLHVSHILIVYHPTFVYDISYFNMFNVLDYIRCRRNCLSVFSEREKMEILKKFRRINDRDDQDHYLQELMEVFPIKKRRLRPEESTVKLRACSVNYFAKYKNRTELVCKQGFLALHGVSKKRCARILASIPKEDASYDSFEDYSPSGIHLNHSVNINNCNQKIVTTTSGLAAATAVTATANALPSSHISFSQTSTEINVLKIINDHIESFPKTVLQHDNKILYCLDSNITTKKMYEMFRKKYPGLNISYPFYSLCFKENFTSQLDLPDQHFDFDNIYEVASHFLCG